MNQVRQLRQIVELFNLTLLPCQQPSSALLVQLLGQEDPVSNNKRREVYREELVNSTIIPVSSGGIELGTYSLIININSSTGSIGIEVCMCNNMTIVYLAKHTFHSAGIVY